MHFCYPESFLSPSTCGQTKMCCVVCSVATWKHNGNLASVLETSLSWPALSLLWWPQLSLRLLLYWRFQRGSSTAPLLPLIYKSILGGENASVTSRQERYAVCTLRFRSSSDWTIVQDGCRSNKCILMRVAWTAWKKKNTLGHSSVCSQSPINRPVSCNIWEP